jgi:hypothetical protein
MFFRRPGGTSDGDGSGGVVAACGAPSLLAELAEDSEDFAELAALLNVGMDAVVAALTSAQSPQTAAELVATLAAPPAPSAAPITQSPPSDGTQHHPASWGGGEDVRWGRWTRARGGARVHREAAERDHGAAVRPAMAMR